MGIFDKLKIYAGKWQVKDQRNFTTEEVNAIDKTEIVASQYGNSCCFFMKSGEMAFIPMASDSKLGIGDSIDMSKATLITLSKTGEDDIMRVKE